MVKRSLLGTVSPIRGLVRDAYSSGRENGATQKAEGISRGSLCLEWAVSAVLGRGAAQRGCRQPGLRISGHESSGDVECLASISLCHCWSPAWGLVGRLTPLSAPQQLLCPSEGLGRSMASSILLQVSVSR